MCVVQVKNIEKIELGRFEMETWYYSPFPPEYRDCKVCVWGGGGGGAPGRRGGQAQAQRVGDRPACDAVVGRQSERPCKAREDAEPAVQQPGHASPALRPATLQTTWRPRLASLPSLHPPLFVHRSCTFVSTTCTSSSNATRWVGAGAAAEQHRGLPGGVRSASCVRGQDQREACI